MIPTLFAPNATDFTKNGIGRLSDAVSCVVHEARNGEFELEMVYPVDGRHYADIVHSAIIVAKPSARRTNLAFRIYQISRAMRGRVTILAQHISYQLNWIPVAPMTATNLTNALQYLKSGAAETCPFNFSADFTSDNDFAIPLPSSIRSYLGGRRGSILDIYGGEWLFDNYNVRLCRSRGSDNGYTIRYGKNLVSLEQEESILNTYTGVYPYWGSDGTLVTLPEKNGTLKIERQDIEPLHRMREIRDDYEKVRSAMLGNPWKNEYLKIILKDTRITPEISDFLHETARANGSEVLELTSEYSSFTGEAAMTGARDIHEKPVEELFARFYTDRNNGVEPDGKDLALMTFVGEMTRAASDKGEPGEEDFRKVLDFVLGQEVGRK